MSTRFIDDVSVVCADWLNAVDDILISLCNASTKEEVLACLDVLTTSEVAQQYLALDGSNRMLAQLQLEGSDPTEDWHAVGRKWVQDLYDTIASQLGYARRAETQVGHGLSIGQPVYWDGNVWQLAIATGLATAGTHVVAVVTDADNFQVAQFGWVDGLSPSALTPGAVHYVDATLPGTLTLVEPSFSNPIILGITDTLGWVMSQRAVSSGGLGFASQADMDQGNAGVAISPDVGNVNYLTKSDTGDGGADQIVLLPITLNELKDTLISGDTNTIELRKSAVASEVPASLEPAEAFCNTVDQKLYMGNSLGVPFLVGDVSGIAHNDLGDRDAADAHPIAAISTLTTELDNRYTKSEIDALLALQPTLIYEQDVAGINLQTNPLDIPIEPGFDYQLRTSGLEFLVDDAAASIELLDDLLAPIAGTYGYEYIGYGDISSYFGSTFSDSGLWWLGYGRASLSGFMQADLSLALGAARAAYRVTSEGYKATTLGGHVNTIAGWHYNSSETLGGIRFEGLATGGACVAGIVQLYKMPRMP